MSGMNDNRDNLALLAATWVCGLLVCGALIFGILGSGGPTS